MKNQLPENIRFWRRTCKMTQEQLAEAMGVSVGAVSKWELGQSAPELGMLMELADFFGVSVDALLGYEMRCNDRKGVAKRLAELRRQKQFSECWNEVEKALQRYPNSFEVVYQCAQLYHLGGLEQKDTGKQRRALELLEHACCLLDQNTDEEISELSLRIEIAEIFRALGEKEQALEELKQNNPCRLNHARIGWMLAVDFGRTDEALSYLSEALLDQFTSLLHIAEGYLYVFEQKQNYQEAQELLEWVLQFCAGLHKPGQTCFIEKTEASLYVENASLYLLMGEREKAEESLRKAKETAQHFDAAPDYKGANVRFYYGADTATAYDDIGMTALDGVERFVKENDTTPGLSKLWEQIKDEREKAENENR